MGVFLKWRRLLKLDRGQEGSAAVELALCLIPLVLLIGGIVDFGDAYFTQQVVSNASREGARYGSRYHVDGTGTRIKPVNFPSNPPLTSIHDWVVNNYGNGNILPSSANVDVPTVAGTGYNSGTSGDILTVTVSAEKNWYFLAGLLGVHNPQTLTATTAMALE